MNQVEKYDYWFLSWGYWYSNQGTPSSKSFEFWFYIFWKRAIIISSFVILQWSTVLVKGSVWNGRMILNFRIWQFPFYALRCNCKLGFNWRFLCDRMVPIATYDLANSRDQLSKWEFVARITALPWSSSLYNSLTIRLTRRAPISLTSRDSSVTWSNCHVI